jgi:hypothetical protein
MAEGFKVTFKPIRMKIWKVDEVRLALLNATRDYATQNLKPDLEKTTSTWVGDRPTWVVKKSLAKETVSSAVLAEGSAFGVRKWLWLEEGTKIRYATMQKGFKAKTKVGNLQSGSGSRTRHPMFVSKHHPKKGIQARNWRKVMQEKHKKPYAKAMRAAMRKGLATATAKGKYP